MSFIINPYVFGSGAVGPSKQHAPVTSGLLIDWDPVDYLTSDPSISTGSNMDFTGWGPGDGSFTFQKQELAHGAIWQAPGSTHECNGYPTGYFNNDGTHSFRLVETGHTFTAITLFAVLKPVSGAGDHALIGGATGSLEYRIKNNLKQDTLRQSEADLGASTTALSTSAFQQVTMTFSGTALNYWLGTSADGTISVSSTTTAATTRIGTLDGILESGLAYVARLLAFDNVLSGGDISTLQSWASLYGV